MQIKRISTIYNRPPTCTYATAGKSRAQSISTQTNEVWHLDDEKIKVEIKIMSVEKRIQEVQNEINAINNTIKETREYFERSEAPSKLKHVTLEY
jgi:hypothetical protein